MDKVLWPEWEEAERFGKLMLWTADNHKERRYGCIIELPCPIKGGEVKVSHYDTSPLLALIGATDKAREMTALPKSPLAESISYAGL